MTRRFGVSREGHAAIMFSVLALPLIMAIGFVVDFAQANRYRSELQNVADAKATAKGVFGNNIGMGTIRIEVSAQAVLGANNTEVAMVVDLSASMVTARMRGLCNAMSAFDKAVMETAPAMQRLRIAVVPFAQTVTLPGYGANWLTSPVEALAASTLKGTCFAPIDTAQDASVAPPTGRTFKLLPNYNRCMSEQAFALTESFTQFRAMANAFKNPPAWRSTWRGQENGPYWGTAIYLAASWANRLLSQSWSPYLPASAAPYSANKASKFAIIMTDGDQLALDSYSRAQAG